MNNVDRIRSKKNEADHAGPGNWSGRQHTPKARPASPQLGDDWASIPTWEVPVGASAREGSERPSREVPLPERERAENEGMVAPPVESNPKGGALQGEGNYTAAHRYEAGVQRSVAQGRASVLGKQAAQALDGPEGPGLREAERVGKRG